MPSVWKRILVIAVVLAAGLGAAAWLFLRTFGSNNESNVYIRRWLTQPQVRDELKSEALAQCPGAPFALPTEGFLGLLWRDAGGPYNRHRRHTGLDIFGSGEPGTVPVYAVYDGYLTRLEDWRSSVIIRHDDPLQAGRTIWTYYTHMASRDGRDVFISDAFPPGTYSRFVPQGTLLGYQGEFNGDSFRVAMHVHVSIVRSEADGSFMNEALLDNTLDPSPYFGMELNFDQHPDRPVSCTARRN